LFEDLPTDCPNLLPYRVMEPFCPIVSDFL